MSFSRQEGGFSRSGLQPEFGSVRVPEQLTGAADQSR